MNRKKILLISIISVLFIALTFGIYYFVIRQDKNSTLTVLEKQWIENNKNNIIDLSIVNDVPIFSYDGEGLFFDFINSLEKNTNLNFNKLSYNVDSKPTSDYSFSIVDKVNDNEIVFYEDNYVIVSKENNKYNRLDKMNLTNVGVLSDDMDNVNYYVGEKNNITFKSYSSTLSLFSDLSDNKVSAIIVPKTTNLRRIIENDKYINYNITDMKKYYVLKLGNNKKLNKIIKKYYKKWYRESYQSSFNNNFSDSYFLFKQIYEQEKVNFRSKRYSYGFIEYAPYDSLNNGKLIGLNDEMIKDFSKISNIEIKYEKYKNYNELLKAFNENKIDFYFNASSINKYDLDVYETNEAYDSEIAVISKMGSNVIINSEKSLNNYDVITLKDSKINKYLNDNKIDTKTYNNIDELLKNKKEAEVIVIDKNTYDTYMYNKLKNYKVDYTFYLNNTYNFVIRSISANKVFSEYLDFYISYVNVKQFNNRIKYTIFEEKLSNNRMFIIMIIILILLIIGTTITFIKKFKPKKKKVTISKEDKLRYIDILTSLKNRNFLNDSIEKWDSSGIYPQAIVIVDLNNIAYINDNYGHEEGDNIIKDAASILIQTQIENTEIIRTNGNEFLIYMVEYEEKQVVSYIRKLNKEFKELNHGFGAAIGYSMIADELKTVDDAINEATLDMRNNKEEIQN